MRNVIRGMLIGVVMSTVFVAEHPLEARAQGPMIAVPAPGYYYVPGGPRAYRRAWKYSMRSPYPVPLVPVVPAYVHGAPHVVRPNGVMAPGMWRSPSGYYYRPNYQSEVMAAPSPSPEPAPPAVEAIPVPEPEG